MALRSDISELLSGFEKRMKFINIVRYLLEYKYPDDIREMIPDREILNNVIVAVLVFIKDKTLGLEQICTIDDIAYFLENLSVVLPFYDKIDTKKLSRYIVVDVLQNGGLMAEFKTFYSTTEAFAPMIIRLINEERGGYHLTDNAFDFLFRSKEVESELDFKIARFRFKEYLKRDNYNNALDASRELVSRIRNMKISMDDFLQRCKENIHKITVDQSDDIINRIRSLLDDEYKELTEIQDLAKKREEELEQAAQNGLTTDLKNHRSALKEIMENISLTINGQRTLINSKDYLSKKYNELISDSFVFNSYERLNFEKDILIPLQKNGNILADASKFLLFTLTKPEFENKFSIENFYAMQGKIDQSQENNGIDIETEQTDHKKQIEIINERFKNICIELISFMNTKNKFKVSEFINSMRIADLIEYCTENALPNVLLSLLSMQEIDIVEWQASEKFTVIPNGEFELSWCLEEIPQEYLQMSKIKFTKSNNDFSFYLQQNEYKRKIEMTDFEIEVIK